MSQTPEDLPQPIYEDPSLAPPPPPPPAGMPTGQYQVPGYVPPPPPGGVHGYVPPPVPGGGGPTGPAKNKLPMIIAGVVGVVAVVGVLIAVMASRGDTPTPTPSPPKTTTKDGPGPTNPPGSEPASNDAEVVAGIKVLFPGANSEEQTCMTDKFAGNTDAIVAVGKKGGTSGDATEASDLADVVTSCVTTDRMAAAVLPNIAQEIQQSSGVTLTQSDLSCAQSALSQLPTSEFKTALEGYYTSPITLFTTSFNDALVSCGG